MIRSRYRFVRPATLDEATALLAAEGGGHVLGGGSVLVPALSAGLEDPRLVLDPGRLGLSRVEATDLSVTIGAGATYAALGASEAIRTRVPLLAAMVAQVTGGPGLWNLATLGGAACYANPASDAPGCLTALEAQFHLVCANGSRLVPAADFFRGPFVTARRPNEILTAIALPASGHPDRCCYLKLKHAASSWPIVTASCLVADAPDGPRLRLCLGGAAPVPVLAEWPLCNFGTDDVGRLAAEACELIGTEWTDELAGPGYRRSVAVTMAARALRSVLEMP
ncbi:FAD binding domain-containing protein [Methylobacterium sp. WSM2598]|uniref:FAD binding domain-containing protein n=1 Tax=Methylobacterium sp. WSM2598 TaxID=398261 RepID=UPI000366CE65|nr:FAD binding domain-containing protein [Methylobacterium sp. WSM2598]